MLAITGFMHRICAIVIACMIVFMSLCVLTPSAAFACGDETGLSCDLNEDDARYMLKEAVAAVQKDETKALVWFTEMSHGFRTEDLYVFCIGPDHVMDAHPDPKINHTDILQSLIDSNNFHFGAAMWKEAKEGEISDITYLWPRLETSTPSVKHTMFTKVKDQICAVGYYE